MGLETEIKELIVQSLNLQDVTPDGIDSQAPLFGDGNPKSNRTGRNVSAAGSPGRPVYAEIVGRLSHA